MLTFHTQQTTLSPQLLPHNKTFHLHNKNTKSNHTTNEIYDPTLILAGADPIWSLLAERVDFSTWPDRFIALKEVKQRLLSLRVEGFGDSKLEKNITRCALSYLYIFVAMFIL